MEPIFKIRYDEKFAKGLKTLYELPADYKYKIQFAEPIFIVCDYGSILSQYVSGDDYCLELCSFNINHDGYIELIVNRPVIFLSLFLKGNLAGELTGNNFFSVNSKVFNLFYLPPGAQRVLLTKGEYVVLLISPPDYYLKSMAAEHKGINNLLEKLLSKNEAGATLKNIILPRAALHIVKRLEKTNKRGASLDIDLRKYILEILGLYNEYYKRELIYTQSYITTTEIANAVKNHILDNLANSNLGGLNELARRFNIGVKPLSREFKKLTGKTIPMFISDERLHKARQLLNNHSIHVFEVALIVGFSDTANFIRKYKKKFGVSPGKQGL